MSTERKKSVPSYRKHKQSGQAIVTLTDAFGRRRDMLLGKHGTSESREKYARLLAEWEESRRNLPAQATTSIVTVAELIIRFWPWVEQYYRHITNGRPTTEQSEFKHSLRPLNHLYGDTPAKDFGPLALKAVRNLLIRGYEHPTYGAQPALARNVVNKRTNRIKKLFKWAVENQLICVTVYQSLLTVDGLERGRSDAKESKKVKPIPRGIVEETLPLLRPMVADMVSLQLETGMRPGELVIMRAIDFDTTGQVWLYKPSAHKTAHLDHDRVVTIGPRGQAIIKRWLTTNTQAYLFSPRRNREEQNAERRQERKTPLYASHMARQTKKRKRNARRAPGERYTPTSYGRAIARAIRDHNAGKPENEIIQPWHPHQLRHTRALEIKRRAGLDAARSVLGHRTPQITEHYAGLDVAKAVEVMAEIG